MSDLLPFLITGIVTGSLYGLAGLGLVLTYRTSGVFNFGHGAVAAGAAFLFYTLHVTHGLAWPLAALATILLFGVVVGVVLERIARGLGDAPDTVLVVATIGVLLAVQGVLFLVYGNVTRAFPEFLPTSGFTVAGVHVTWAQVLSVAVATASAVGLSLFLQRSRLGVAMRAVVDNPTLLALAGDNPTQVRRYAWAIGSAFAAVSGILLAPTLNLNVTLLTLLVVQAFGACALGFFSSLPLTYAGGIAVGVTGSIATKYFTDQPWNGLPSAVPFLVLVAVLLAVPGRLPRRRAVQRSLVTEARPRPRRVTVAMLVLAVAAAAAVPAVAGTYLPIWSAGLITLVVFASLALVVWTSGQLSLCHLAFVAVGATSMAHFAGGMRLPWLLALVLSGVVALPVGALVAVPAIRLPGVYLALGTLGFAILMQTVVYPTSFMFGYTLTVNAPRPVLGIFDGRSDTQFYYLVLAVVALSVTLVVVLTRSRLGRLLRALAESPTMLSTHGLDVNVTRLLVFCVSASLAAIAGALTVTLFGSASAPNYGPIQSLLYLALLAVCGTSLLKSSVRAAAAVAVLPAYVADIPAVKLLADGERQTLLFGGAAVVAALVIARRREIAAWVAAASARSEGRAAFVRRPRPVHDDQRRLLVPAEGSAP